MVNIEQNIKTIKLTGTHEEMGYKYGQAMQPELLGALVTLKDYFINQHNIDYSALVNRANDFYNRYSYSYKLILSGISSGSGLSLDEVKILNGMETLNSLITQKGLNMFSEPEISACAFIFLPPEKTYSGYSLIGRNYDFPAPYSEIAVNLTVTILEEPNTVATATIGLPGQIYCPSCVNAEGNFMELNNGMPSGGYYKNLDRQSLLINMLYITQNSFDSIGVEKGLMATESDYSLIINTANQNKAKSYEFSTLLGMRSFTPNPTEVFASTNFFLNSSWGNSIPTPTDYTTWIGVTRRDNLLNLASQKEVFTLDDFKSLMNTPIDQGGAVWDFTIYQIIYDSSDQMLYLKRSLFDNDTWNEINLNESFIPSSAPSPSENSDSSHAVLGLGVATGVLGVALIGLISYTIYHHCSYAHNADYNAINS